MNHEEMAVCSDLSFVIAFLKPKEFMETLDVCGSLILDVTDTVIGDHRAIAFFKITAFLHIINMCLKKQYQVRVHILNNDFF